MKRKTRSERIKSRLNKIQKSMECDKKIQNLMNERRRLNSLCGKSLDFLRSIMLLNEAYLVQGKTQDEIDTILDPMFSKYERREKLIKDEIKRIQHKIDHSYLVICLYKQHKAYVRERKKRKPKPRV